MPKSKQITNIPKLTRSLSKQPATTLKKVTNTPTSTIVESSPKSNSTKQPPVMLRRSSNSSIISTPATTRSCELKKRSVLANVSTQRNNFEGRLQSSIAANKVLNKLKSSDANTKCLGIQTLIERLKDIPYTSSRKSALPSNVPKKADLLPVLIDLLSCKNLDTKVYEKLTGWDSIADIFVRTLSIRSYCPTLIIADEQRRSQTLDNTQMKIFTSYSQGLKRAKMLLKRNDPLLAHHLLNILKSVMSSEQKVLDASVKHDLQLNASYQPSLELGLLKWMNELIQDYVGLPEDEDKEMLKEGSRWLTESDVTPAEQWFESPMNIQAYTGFVIQQLLETQEEDSKFGILCSMLRSLKMGNERVFEAEMKTLNNVQAEQIKNAIASNSSYSTMDDDSTLSGQVLTQKRKRDSLCLDFSVEAAENDAEEERNRKYLKVEHLTGVNMLGFEVFKFDSFSSSSSEEDPFGFEATKYEVTKNEMIGGEARRSL
ncbi:hypothetical protein BD770DRAFT_395161 [Pilaira anomala]|nr:hypothetical protein BD770DRAFT_395161 [Pilaira anomala]